MDKEDQDTEVIKDSPDSPEPLNKKPRLSPEEVQPLERAKGTSIQHILLPPEKLSVRVDAARLSLEKLTIKLSLNNSVYHNK